VTWASIENLGGRVSEKG
jgi:hypothetical protein